jgi:hypothetical protein
MVRWKMQCKYLARELENTVFCLIIGGPEFPVNIDETQTVGALKDKIKEKAKIPGPPNALTLYRINVTGRDAQTRMETVVREAQNIRSFGALDPLRSLAVVFAAPDAVTGAGSVTATGLPSGTIHILVELPLGESIDSIGPRAWCVAETCPISSATHMSAESESIDPKAPSPRSLHHIVPANDALARAGFTLLEPWDYDAHPPTQIYSKFFVEPQQVIAPQPGDIIELHSSELLHTTNSQLYFFKQYAYMKERIMRLRDENPMATGKSQVKSAAIVTGTPGIGRVGFILLYSSNGSCRKIDFS